MKRRYKWQADVDRSLSPVAFAFKDFVESHRWRSFVELVFFFFLILVLVLIPVLFFTLASILLGAMFQYSLWSIFGKDVPFLLDVVGGLALNAITFFVFVGCLVFRIFGFPIPFVS